MSTPSDDKKMIEATENQKARNLHEIEALINAVLAKCRPLICRDADMMKTLEQFAAAWQVKRNEFLLISVALTSLLKCEIHEIPLHLILWKKRMDDMKTAEFMRLRYDDMKVC